MGKAVRLFNGNAEQTLYSRLTPTQGQLEFLRTQWNSLADHLIAELANKYGYPISTWLQGSYKYGTLIKPVHRGEEYDVDVGVYFKWVRDGNAEPAPEQLRDWVQAELLEYKRLETAVKSVEQPPKERCSRAVYSKQFHIDTPVYHLDPDADLRRLACLSGKWEVSDPKVFHKWFKNAVGDDGREQLRRLVRYLKGWAAVAFEDTKIARPSSILLTVLATEAFNSQLLGLITRDDEDALILVVQRITDRLRGSQVVLNPAEPEKNENLNRIPDEAWDYFFATLEGLNLAATRASDANDEAAAALAWADAFSFLMPLPEAESVEVVEEYTGTALMQVPDIRVDVFKRDPRKLVNSFVNEVPTVPKDCDLVFTITNPHIVPPFATVEWTVRNDGEEAEYLGDLGHRRTGARLLTVDEHTAYAGRQYMDCVIKQSGQVIALRRVPVIIRDLQYPARNPTTRPSYTKIKSVRNRR